MKNDRDFQAENWWATISGAGTGVSGIDPTWADDYTRHRSGSMLYNSTISGVDAATSTTYSGVTDMYRHSGDNQPTDVYYGRKSILDVNP